MNKEKHKYEDDFHNCTNERLAEIITQYANRHVGDEKEAILEAAKRLKERWYNIPIPFNHEAFE